MLAARTTTTSRPLQEPPLAVTPSAQYSVTIRVEMDSQPTDLLGQLTMAIGAVGGDIGAIDLVGTGYNTLIRELVVNASDQEHADAIVAAAGGLDGVRVLSSFDRTFRMHQGGKIEMTVRVPLENRDDLSMAYMPGVARVCRAIAEDRQKAFDFTIKRNTVAVVTDGTAVLGLGDIGAGRRHARDGGQGDAVQGIRRRRRLPDLPRLRRTPRRSSGRSPRSRRLSAASTWRTSRRRAASRSRTASRRCSTSRSSTTTSTAPRSWCSPRWSTP